MQCAQCDHWVHAKCEGLSGEWTEGWGVASAMSCPWPQALRGQQNILSDLGQSENFHVTETIFPFPALAVLDEDYEILSGLPDSVLYTCGPCAGAAHPRWREALSGALQGGLRQVLQGLLSSKVAGPLLLCAQVCGPG